MPKQALLHGLHQFPCILSDHNLRLGEPVAQTQPLAVSHESVRF